MIDDLHRAIIEYLTNGTDQPAVDFRAACGPSGIDAGTRYLFAAMAPEGTAPPYTTFAELALETDGVLGRVDEIPRVQYSFWDPSKAKTDALGRAFDAAIANRPEALTLDTGRKVAQIRRIGGTRFKDPDGEHWVLHHTYRFYIG